MPEGDTLYRTAVSLRKALAGHTVLRFESSVQRVAEVDQRTPVAGRTVQDVQAIGKNLLIVLRHNPSTGLLAEQVPSPESWPIELLRGDLVLHTHLRMSGSWHIYKPGDVWKMANPVALIETESYLAPCFLASVVELLTARETVRHPMLVSRGPDAITEDFDAAAAFERLRRHNDVPIGVAVMNQRSMAGLGNVYKSEVLYIRRISPFNSVGSLSDDALKAVIDEGHKLLMLNRNRAGRRTRFTLNRTQRHWVYGRSGEPCYTCGVRILMRRQGLEGRSTYYCPNCQNVRLETSDVIRT